MSPRTQAQRSAATRGAVIAAGRALFGERGFEATSIEELALLAGVSKGALYHHFPDKAEVLAAVYESLEQELCDQLISSAGAETDPVEQLRLGAHAFLDECLDPVVRRIALQEAPNALGWARWREIDARYGFGLLKVGLLAAAEDGRGPLETVEERAHLLLAALIEACLLLGTSDEPVRSRAVLRAIVDDLVDGLTAPAAST